MRLEMRTVNSPAPDLLTSSTQPLQDTTTMDKQEIPPEIIDKAFEWTLDDGGCIGIMDIGDPYYRDLRREIITGFLVAVLPDLQRPLLEEIEQLHEKIADTNASFNAVYALQEQYKAEAENWRETARMAQGLVNVRTAERDARPDLTVEEKQQCLEGLNAVTVQVYGGYRLPVVESARAKLERSPDA